jgi:GH15 family glucan-1,4-alpha-glucosidase
VGRNGSVDWLCLPRFDSASCFTALLGEEKHGRWLISPAGEVRIVSRRYREGTLVLETDFAAHRSCHPCAHLSCCPRGRQDGPGLPAAAGHRG